MSLRAKPMHVFCKFIGVAPYSFDPGSSERKFKTSRLGVIYSSFINFLLICFAIVNYQTMYNHLTSGSDVTIGAQWLQFYINNGFSVLIITANILQQGKVVEVFNAIFDATGNSPKEISDNREIKKEIFCGTLILIVTIFLHILTTLTSYFDNDKIIDYYWFPYGILYLLNALVVLQFLCGVVRIGIKFRALYIRLEDFINERQTYMKNYETPEIIDVVVNKAAEEHLEIVSETNLLITAFSYQLFLSFVAAFTISVTGLYLICKRIIQHRINETKSSHDVIEKDYDWWCLTCYPLLHSILLGVTVGICNWTVNQATSLDGTVPRFQRIFRLSENSCISSFCHQLSLQRVSFNVFHLFKIEPSIICSITSTVFTYLIILVQFELSQDTDNTAYPDVFNSIAYGPVNDSY